MKLGKINMKNKNLLMGVILLGLLVLAGMGYHFYTGYYAYTDSLEEPQVIRIGHIGPLTGVMATYGEQEAQGIDFAVEEINANGGIKGKKLVVIHEDDQLDPTTATSALNKLITVDKVPAVIGELSVTNTLAIAPIAQKNKVVLISSLASSSKLSGAGDYIFKIYFTTTQESKKLVELTSSLNLTNGAILYINHDYGIDLAQLVKEEFVKNGGTISISEGYSLETHRKGSFLLFHQTEIPRDGGSSVKKSRVNMGIMLLS
jgi:branched-chain amino acid transport system substrate-binding protein